MLINVFKRKTVNYRYNVRIVGAVYFRHPHCFIRKSLYIYCQIIRVPIESCSTGTLIF